MAGICLSLLQDDQQVAAVLNQSWVDAWHGWNDLDADGSDSVAMDVAERLLRIAGANVPVKMMTNSRRLKELAAQGLHLKVASSHGANNCLIDSLLLGLVLKGLSPREYTVAERKALCATCREELRLQHGVPLGVYLDGHRDTPRILDFSCVGYGHKIFQFECVFTIVSTTPSWAWERQICHMWISRGAIASYMSARYCMFTTTPTRQEKGIILMYWLVPCHSVKRKG